MELLYPSKIPVSNIPTLTKVKTISNNILSGYYSRKYERKYGSVIHNMMENFVDNTNVLDKEKAFKWAFPKVQAINNAYTTRLSNTINTYNTNITIKSEDVEEIFKELSISKNIGKSKILSGKIDKIITTKDNNMYIIDYKSTLKMKNINSFRNQAKSYQYLLNRQGITGYKNVYFAIHYLDFNILDTVKLDMDISTIEHILMNM